MTGADTERAADVATDLDGMAEVFRVLGHPARLEILRLTGEGECSVGAVIQQLGLPQPVVSQHLRLLRDCELVRVRKDGNRRLYSANAERASEVRSFLATMWPHDLDRLKVAAERRQRQRARRPPPVKVKNEEEGAQ